ncbi:MAG: Putative IstB-like ATP-binding protein [Leptospirillum sp. Group II 'C75']|jgi:DNA replication protein DnaC|uniref:Putative IstB-like ATP-binding protein n=1 Tax=Leptospirillum sp. Group II '5-way CG' TaxID=419541 RepID=B6ARZ7_9BACT|nr:IS21-like element helper ATPase IstB [Leptospirillum sp. Group II 'CF-1']AKS23154.1 ATPase AAA [Leptospirillum sp. Group II 'CF-1']EAY57049.1 MAG: putative IstB-like ATP-binding protein [Leptospirillum rubarum]EDZ38254.1 MAG: Putative IstB-like ATP-binding protein [Leptospirillum sp. Group II '5-way CG']EIJ75548.1 MAG: Putative IstB-like ATP-binding protein [Leptospirillum sp. Group II 'C75']
MTEKSEQLSETLTRLRMPGLRRTFPERVRMAAEQGLSYEDFLLGCLQDEVTSRQDNDLKRRLKEARFPVIKSFDQFDFSAQPVLPREKLLSLGDGDWLDRRENVLLVGQVGTGKSHIATALGVEVIRNGARVRFITAPALIQELLLAEKEHRLARFLKAWKRNDLVIVDELGYVSLGPGGALLFQFCSDRYERGSLLFTSNLDFSRWSEVFGDPSLTTALLDRLTHHAHVVVFQGESYRFRERRNNVERKKN